MEQGQTLNLKFRGDQANARNVAARMRPTLGDTGADWVCAYWRGDNRNCARYCASSVERLIGRGDNDIGFVINQRLRLCRHLLLRTHAKIDN